MRAEACAPVLKAARCRCNGRVPKRGFNNIFATEYAIVNVSDLDVFEDGAVVDSAALKDKGLVGKTLDGVKILGNGDISQEADRKSRCFFRLCKGEDRSGRRKGRGRMICLKH